jgi:hypothetical protein
MVIKHNMNEGYVKGKNVHHFLYNYSDRMHNIHSFIQGVCLTTGPKTLPKRALHIVWAKASSFKWEYPLLSLWSSNSFLRLLPRLPVTSIPPSIFPSVTRYRRQFLRKMWPIQFAFRLLFYFCEINGLIITNTWFRKPKRRLYTSKAPGDWSRH